VFNESLIRFFEFHGERVDQKLHALYGEEGASVMENLNRYLLKNLTDPNVDIRFLNLVFKFSKLRLRLPLVKYNLAYTRLLRSANRILKIRLCE
jgi:hypothetical protein